MAASGKPSRWAAGQAGAVTIVTTVLYATDDYRPVSMSLTTSGSQATSHAGFRSLWLVISLYSVLAGALFMVGCIRPGSLGKSLLVFAAFLPVADALTVSPLVGLFIGTLVLAIVVVLVYSGIGFSTGRQGPASTAHNYGVQRTRVRAHVEWQADGLRSAAPVR